MFDEARAFVSLVLPSAIAQNLASLVLTTVIFGVVWVWGRERLRARKIQADRRADLAQFGHEMRYAAMTFLVGTGVALFLLYASRHGYTRLIVDVGDTSVGRMLVSAAAMVVLNDAWFYFVHRLLHTRWFFRHVHRIHHRSVDVTPFSAYSFHPIEGLLLSAWVVPWVFLVPTWVPVLASVQLYGYLNNLVAHLGYEFYPRWFARVFPFRWLTTSTYHNVHHTRFRGNYALTFRWWDRWLGTEVADYRETFEALPRSSGHPG